MLPQTTIMVEPTLEGKIDEPEGTRYNRDNQEGASYLICLGFLF